jgi:hypothetical protein
MAGIAFPLVVGTALVGNNCVKCCILYATYGLCSRIPPEKEGGTASGNSVPAISR